MTIDSFGIHRLNNSMQSPLPSPLPQMPSENSVTREDFAGMMRRMQGARNENEAPPARIPAIVRDKELFEAALELEGILVQNLIRGMRNTVQRTNLIETGFAGEVYEDMLFDEYARIVTRNAGFGFAEMVYRELTGQR